MDYKDENTWLMLGDCLERMKEIPDGSVDMILCDLPYGTTACKWDSVIPLDKMWEQLKRVIKPSGATALFGVEPFSSHLRMSNIKDFKYDWVWDKHIPRGFQVAKYRPMSKLENVSMFCNGRMNYYPILIERDKPVTIKNYSKVNANSSNDIGKYNDPDKKFTYTHKTPDNLITGKWEANKGKVHPTQKPVSLMEYLITTHTIECETVLDFTMGSGTTGVACKNLNRKFIGVERDLEYFNIAKERILSEENLSGVNICLGDSSDE